MKKSLLGAFFIFALIFTPDIAKAESMCSYSEQARLNAIAANVKANYEVIEIKDGIAYELDSGLEEDPIVDVYIKAFQINVLNITDDIYVKVTNSYDNTEWNFDYTNTVDNIVSFQTKNKEELITYTINVYSNKSPCVGKLIRTIKVVTPIYNLYSSMGACDDYPKYYYCQEFLTTGSIEYETFSIGLNKYIEDSENKLNNQEKNENMNFFEKIKAFYNEHKLIMNLIMLGSVVTIGGTIVILRKKRRRVL